MSSQKDQLLVKFQEFDIAQQTLDRTRSEMHCIIAALPSEKQSKGNAIPPASRGDRPFVIHPLNVGCEKPMPPHIIGNKEDYDRRDHPVDRVPQPDDPELFPFAKPPVVKEKSKQTRAKRVCEADIRKAVKLIYDDNLTQKEAETICGLPLGTLSRRKGKQIMEGYRKEWGTPHSLNSLNGVSRKELEKALRFGDDR